MFRRLPQQGGTPRDVSEIVNRILDGKINSVGLITLDTGGATSTTLYAGKQCQYASTILCTKGSLDSLNTADFCVNVSTKQAIIIRLLRV